MTSVRVMLKGDDMQLVEVLGFVAGACTTAGLSAAGNPGLAHAFRSRYLAVDVLRVPVRCVLVAGIRLRRRCPASDSDQSGYPAAGRGRCS